MSTKKPTTPKGKPAALSPAEHVRGLQVRSGVEPDIEEDPTTSQVEPEGEKEEGQKGSPPRRTRLVVSVALIVFAAVGASIAVTASMRGSSTQRPRSAPGAPQTKAQKPDGRRSGRTRWVREPGESVPRRHRRAAPASPHVRHKPRSSREPRRPAPTPSDAPSRPPAPGASLPESALVPSAPAPPPPSEPKEGPHSRDGATESTEFGL
jgi:hypothetical protein